jgi:hypothetical protein
VTSPQPEYQIIPLSQGKVAYVSLEDFTWLSQWKWHASKRRQLWYATRSVRINGKTQTIRMHREILGLKHDDPRMGDHKNPQDTLDNRRSNLRIANAHSNGWNRPMMRNNTTGFKGVSFHKASGKYAAQIATGIGNRSKWLGLRNTPEEAAELYREAAVTLYGDFARFE